MFTLFIESIICGFVCVVMLTFPIAFIIDFHLWLISGRKSSFFDRDVVNVLVIAITIAMCIGYTSYFYCRYDAAANLNTRRENSKLAAEYCELTGDSPYEIDFFKLMSKIGKDEVKANMNYGSANIAILIPVGGGLINRIDSYHDCTMREGEWVKIDKDPESEDILYVFPTKSGYYSVNGNWNQSIKLSDFPSKNHVRILKSLRFKINPINQERKTAW